MGAGSQPTRGMSAQSAEGLRRAVRKRQAMPNGLWGMALLPVLGGDDLRHPAVHLLLPGLRRPPVAPSRDRAPRAGLAADRHRMAGGHGVPDVDGVTSCPEWGPADDRVDDLPGLRDAGLLRGRPGDPVPARPGQVQPQATAYGSIYFTILAVHHAHVLLGLVLDVGILWQVATRGLTSYWLVGVRGLALYWYVVAGLAVLVVFTQLTPAL